MSKYFIFILLFFISSYIQADVLCEISPCVISGEQESVRVPVAAVLDGFRPVRFSNATVSAFYNHGVVNGSVDGVEVFGGSHVQLFGNSGSIIGGQYGVLVRQGEVGVINNYSTVSGGIQGVAALQGRVGIINNFGTISGGLRGVTVNALIDGGTRINHFSGLMSGSNWAVISDAPGNDFIFNWYGGDLSGGVLNVNVFSVFFESARILGVNRDFFMPAGSELNLLIGPSNADASLAAGRQYVLVQGVGNANGNLIVHVDTPYLNFSNLSFVGGVTGVLGLVSAPDILGAGGSENAQRAANAISPLLLGMSVARQGDPLLDGLSGGGALTVSEQLVPVLAVGAFRVADHVQNLSVKNIMRRLDTARGESYRSEEGVNFWMSALNESRSSNANRVGGLESDVMTLGLDNYYSDESLVGFAFGRLGSGLSTLNDSVTADGYALTVYGTYEPSQWFLNFGFSLGAVSNSSARYVAGVKAGADYKSYFHGVDFLGGIRLVLISILFLSPV